MTEKPVTAAPVQKVWEGGELVELPPEGHYRRPNTGEKYFLGANMSFHSGPYYTVTGWPTFWQELVPEQPE